MLSGDVDSVLRGAYPLGVSYGVAFDFTVRSGSRGMGFELAAWPGRSNFNPGEKLSVVAGPRNHLYLLRKPGGRMAAGLSAVCSQSQDAGQFTT